MVLSNLDRNLLERCLSRKPRAWEDFVDRFLGLVTHVINHTAQARSIRLTPQDTEDLASEVFLAIIRDDFAILRRFRGESSLATYLTVIARRVVVRQMLRNKSPARLNDADQSLPDDDGEAPIERIDDEDEVERLLEGLDQSDAEIVRLYHLEGKSYQEISETVQIPINSVGPTLSRARAHLRRAGTAAE